MSESNSEMIAGDASTIPESEIFTRPPTQAEYEIELTLAGIYGPTLMQGGAIQNAPVTVVHLCTAPRNCTVCHDANAVSGSKAHSKQTPAAQIVKQVIDGAAHPMLVFLTGNRVHGYVNEKVIRLFNLAGCPVTARTDCRTAASRTDKWLSALMHLSVEPGAPSFGPAVPVADVVEAIKNSPRHEQGVSLKVIIGDVTCDLDYALNLFKKVAGKTTRAVQYFVEPAWQPHRDEGLLSDSACRHAFQDIADILRDEREYNVRVVFPTNALLQGRVNGY